MGVCVRQGGDDVSRGARESHTLLRICAWVSHVKVYLAMWEGGAVSGEVWWYGMWVGAWEGGGGQVCD